MNRLDMSTGAIILLSLLYFFCGFTMLFALLLAIAFHELGHIAALTLFDGRIRGFKMSMIGMCISYCGLKNRIEEFISLLSGPLSGIILAYLCSYLGRYYNSDFLLTCSGFGVLLSTYNLLPILPLDGGRMMRCLLAAAIGEDRADGVCITVGVVLSAALALLGGFNINTEWGRAILLAALILLVSQMKIRGLL